MTSMHALKVGASAAAVAAITLTSTLGLSGAAHAEQARAANVSVSIKLAGDNQSLGGTVKSSKAGCKTNVKVKLIFEGPGAAPTKVRTDKSAGSGKWKVPAPSSAGIPAGKYYVTIDAKGTCEAAKSKTIKVS